MILSRLVPQVWKKAAMTTAARAPSSATTAALRSLDTTTICDADKKLRTQDASYKGISVLPNLLSLPTKRETPMAGIVRTVQLTHRNDFLGVMQGLLEAQEGEVLVVATLGSDRALAGDLLAAETERKSLEGIVILDGFMRDTANLREVSEIRCYAKGVTPYAGTCIHPAKMQQDIYSGDVMIRSGEIMVGDDDGVIVGSASAFTRLLPVAQGIHAAEANLRSHLLEGTPLDALTNIRQHLESRLKGEDSELAFQ
jgi:regulator of RNase E activity RraA